MKPILASLTLLLAASALGAQNAMDMSMLKQDTQVFERILDEKLRQSFSHPYAVTGGPQASYLQGYGLVISFHLNVNRARVRTPFGEMEVSGRTTPSDLESRSRDEQLRRVREVIVESLLQYAAAIQQLNAHDRVSISAHIEDRNELDPMRRKTVLVVTASRDDVDLVSMRRISSRQFRERVHVLEY